MDEIEKRLSAIEMVLIEVGAWLEPAVLEDAALSIRAGLEAEIAEEEGDIRRQALSIIEDARRRYAGPGPGAFTPKG